MSDGLAQLAQRGRRTRDIPPPRNPARTSPVTLAPVPDQPLTTPDSAATEPVTPEPAAVAAPANAEPAKAAERPALKVVTIYLEQDDDDLLETITHIGRTSRPKVAISRSAVVRLALERLREQLAAGEIVDELSSRGDQQGVGRKRR